MSHIASLILAAGRSSRMQTPKALLHMQHDTLNKITFAEHLVKQFKMIACDPIILITGYHAIEIKKQLPTSIRQLYATRWAEGMRTSLAMGIEAVADQDIIFTHVDHPFIQSKTLQYLSQCTQLSIPTYKGQTGHPVFLPKSLTHHVLREDSLPLNQVLLNLNPNYIEVDDPGILININTPAAYQRYCK